MAEYAGEYQGLVRDVNLAWQTARYENAAQTALVTVRATPGFDGFGATRHLQEMASQIALRLGKEEELLPAYRALEYAIGILHLPVPIEYHFEYIASERSAQAAVDFAAGVDRGEDPAFTIEDNGMLLAAGAITCNELLARLGIESPEQTHS